MSSFVIGKGVLLSLQKVTMIGELLNIVFKWQAHRVTITIVIQGQKTLSTLYSCTFNCIVCID